MRPIWAVVMTVAAAVAGWELRTLAPGWAALIYLYAIVPLLLALSLLLRPRLGRWTSILFVAQAAAMVLFGLLMPEESYGAVRAPIAALLGQSEVSPGMADVVRPIGFVCGVAWLPLVVLAGLVAFTVERTLGPLGYPVPYELEVDSGEAGRVAARSRWAMPITVAAVVVAVGLRWIGGGWWSVAFVAGVGVAIPLVPVVIAYWRPSKWLVVQAGVLVLTSLVLPDRADMLRAPAAVLLGHPAISEHTAAVLTPVGWTLAAVWVVLIPVSWWRAPGRRTPARVGLAAGEDQ
ncbi:hypothetical protein [Kutzneria sp. NPDC052558]|uniref:hypothetical protein n=1 Tax=Kutzneria sp. NPDC052558 TaxID=3364121 RepID=UPI0037C8C761